MSVQKRVVLRIQPRCQATLTQPLQCVLRHHVANLHVSTHVATSDDDNHAAIPMRSATTIQETNRATHTGTTTRCRTQRRNQNDHPPHTGGTFHRRLQPLYTEKCKVSCSGFLPNTSVTISLRHHFPSSPLPFVTISLGHHCPSSPPCVIACYSLVMYRYVMSSLTPPFTNVKSHNSICP